MGMEGSRESSNGVQGIGGDHDCEGIESGYVALKNSYVEEGSPVGDRMNDNGQFGIDHPDENDKPDASLNNEGVWSPAVSSTNSADAPLSDYSSSSFGSAEFNNQRASDLLVMVSICAEPNNTKIIELAYSAMEELTKIAVAGKPLWQPHKEGKYETLNDIEYLREFGHVDATLREIIKMVEVGELGYLPSFDSCGIEYDLASKVTATEALQVEASRDAVYVKMNPIDLVELLMDSNKWLGAFSNIVSRAKMLGILSNGVEGGYDGKVQVMTAEFHLPTPHVPTRECYFARYSKQLSDKMWGVVDVSLEKFFPYPSTSFRRRPSGCLISEMKNGYSKVIWVEHVEADYRLLNTNFQPLVTSGLAFRATRWVASIIRQCEWSETLKARSTPTEDGVLIPQAGRTSLLKLAERMMRSFCADISASKANLWMQVPLFNGSEDVRVMIKNSVDDPGKPPGTTVVFASSLWIPASPTKLFNFLRDENSRNTWDLLLRGHSIRELAYVFKGRDPGNRVSIMQVNSAPDKIEILYVQDSYTDSTGSYVIYAPMEPYAMSVLLNGGNPDNTAILPSGFAILPDGIPRNDYGEDSRSGSLLTVAFHITDSSASSRAYVLPESILTIHNIISETVIAIKTAVLYNNLLDELLEE